MNSTHVIDLNWHKETAGFGYREYNRNHVVRFAGGQALSGSAAPGYLGNAALANPEELFAASLSGCHMLTFLALASMQKFVVERYDDHAVAHLDKNSAGKVMIVKVVLNPVTRFSGERQPSAEELAQLHRHAHEECFIARSVTTEVQIAL